MVCPQIQNLRFISFSDVRFGLVNNEGIPLESVYVQLVQLPNERGSSGIIRYVSDGTPFSLSIVWNNTRTGFHGWVTDSPSEKVAVSLQVTLEGDEICGLLINFPGQRSGNAAVFALMEPEDFEDEILDACPDYEIEVAAF